jgi:hypothetical protein
MQNFPDGKKINFGALMIVGCVMLNRILKKLGFRSVDWILLVRPNDGSDFTPLRNFSSC